MSRRAGAAGAAGIVVALLSVLVVAPGRADEPPAPHRDFRVADPRIDESSGLAAGWSLPGVLWTVNDSGGAAEVYGLDPRGRTVATVALTGTTNRDWEAVAVGPRAGGGSWLWVGDIGDNNSVWPSVRVYRVAEPDRRGRTSVVPTSYDLVYPDGPRDAEALLVGPSDGRLYVVSKRVQGAAVYRAPAILSAGHLNRLTRVASAPPLVTDGAFAPDGRVALRDYLQAWLSTGVRGPRERMALPLQPQGESLTWSRDGAALLVGSEGEHSEVWRVPLAAPASPSMSPSPSPSASSIPSAAAAAPPAERGGSLSPWVVAVAGLVLGAGAALVMRRRRPRPRRAASRPDRG